MSNAPELINELARRILRNEPVSDEELREAIALMRSQRTSATKAKEEKEKAAEISLDSLFSSLPDKKESNE